MKTGWMCPRCGVCWSPKVERCECKPQAAPPHYVYPYRYYWYPPWQAPYWHLYPLITLCGVTTTSGASGTYTINAAATNTTGGVRSEVMDIVEDSLSAHADVWQALAGL